MPVSIGSLASGLPADIVDKLSEVERKPIYNLERSKASIENKKKLLMDLKARINAVPIKNIKDAYGFREVKTEVSDQGTILATADKRMATPATYNIQVKELATKASALSTGFPDKDKSEIGSGYIKFKTASGESEELFIGPGNNTLESVAKAINDSDFGFNANIINDGKDKEIPYKLLLSGKDTGSKEDVTWPTFYFLDGDYDFYIESEKPAKDAVILLDGQEIKVPGNKIKDLVSGVSIELLKVSDGKDVGLTVSEDIPMVSDKVKNIIDSVNKVIDFIQSQNKLTGESNTRDTLGGDITLSTIESKIRNLFSSPIPGASTNLRYLSEVGIGFQRNGKLAFDETKFSKMIGERFNYVSKLFVGINDGKTGLIPLLNQEFSNFVASDSGVLTNREAGLGRQIKNIDRDIERKEINVARKKEQLKNTFARLESSMSSLKSQSSYVQNALGGNANNLNLSNATVS